MARFAVFFFLFITCLNSSVFAENQAPDTQEKLLPYRCQALLWKTTDLQNNPLIARSPHFLGAPDYSRIQLEHFLPAILHSLETDRKCIEQIKNNPRPPTFQNVMGALNRCGEKSLAGNVLEHLVGVIGSVDHFEILKVASPHFVQFSSNMFTDEKLYARVKVLHEQKSKLRPTQARLVEQFYRGFFNNGVHLSVDKKAELLRVKMELSTLSQKFVQNELNDKKARAIWLPDEIQLAGVSKRIVDQAKSQAKEFEYESGFVIDMESVGPAILEYSPNRSLREQVWRADYSVASEGEISNDPVIRRLLRLRQQEAEILGYPTFAHLNLVERMAKTPEKAKSFLEELTARAVDKKERDLQIVRDEAAKDGIIQFEPWDRRYYMRIAEESRYNIDYEALRPYFEVSQVSEKLFQLVKKLYGVTFVLDQNIPTAHPDARAYRVLNRAGNPIGLVYFDLHQRPGKSGGAWMGPLRVQYYENNKRVAPLINVVANFPPLNEQKQSLLSLSEVRILFHEMGHALHALFSEVRYADLASPNVPWDFVELPSQLMENWMKDPGYLKTLGQHFETGEAIPDATIDSIQRSQQFLQAYLLTRYAGMALMDLNLHLKGLKPEMSLAEAQTVYSQGLIPAEHNLSLLNTFSHIFGGGYAAGYYSYKWSEILDADAFGAFQESGLYNSRVAGRFRREVLSKGNSIPAEEQFRNFRGRDPDSTFYLERAGLAE